MLFHKTDQVVKIRTLLTNYASFYDFYHKLHSDYTTVMEEFSCSWEGFMEWVTEVHVPFIVKQHQERDHSRNNIKRYFNDLFIYFGDSSIFHRRKYLKYQTNKLKTGGV